VLFVMSVTRPNRPPPEVPSRLPPPIGLEPSSPPPLQPKRTSLEYQKLIRQKGSPIGSVGTGVSGRDGNFGPPRDRPHIKRSVSGHGPRSGPLPPIPKEISPHVPSSPSPLSPAPPLPTPSPASSPKAFRCSVPSAQALSKMRSLPSSVLHPSKKIDPEYVDPELQDLHSDNPGNGEYAEIPIQRSIIAPQVAETPVPDTGGIKEKERPKNGFKKLFARKTFKKAMQENPMPAEGQEQRMANFLRKVEAIDTDCPDTADSSPSPQSRTSEPVSEEVYSTVIA